jgi:hypothetical protein
VGQGEDGCSCGGGSCSGTFCHMRSCADILWHYASVSTVYYADTISRQSMRQQLWLNRPAVLERTRDGEGHFVVVREISDALAVRYNDPWTGTESAWTSYTDLKYFSETGSTWEETLLPTTVPPPHPGNQGTSSIVLPALGAVWQLLD